MYAIIRMPLACLVLLIYVFLQYKTKKRLANKTSRVFEQTVFMVILHVLAAVITEYTVNNRDIVSPVFNLIWHIIFLLSLTCAYALLYYYTITYIERGAGEKKKLSKILMVVVTVISGIAQLILPHKYMDTPFGSYLYGMKVFALYFASIYMLMAMVVDTIRYRNVIGKEKSRVLIMSAVVFVLNAIIQIIFPFILLTYLSLTMVALGIMVNSEDPHMYIDYKTKLYNELGCSEILQELLLIGKPFEIVTYVFMGDENDINTAMQQIHDRLPEEKLQIICGTTADNVLVVIPLQFLNMISEIPPKLPFPTVANSSFKYDMTRMQLTNNDSVFNILSQIRDFKINFENYYLQRDELTGLYRRKAFIRYVETLIAGKEEFTMIMLDLDDFKAINDTRGHKAGDEVLQIFSEAITSALRDSDIVCRMGGDEFAFVIKGVNDKQEIVDIMSRIKDKLEEISISRGDLAKVGFSLGATICNKNELVGSFQELYAETDKALYRAKKNGKARLCFSDE